MGHPLSPRTFRGGELRSRQVAPGTWGAWTLRAGFAERPPFLVWFLGFWGVQ